MQAGGEAASGVVTWPRRGRGVIARGRISLPSPAVSHPKGSSPDGRSCDGGQGRGLLLKRQRNWVLDKTDEGWLLWETEVTGH